LDQRNMGEAVESDINAHEPWAAMQLEGFSPPGFLVGLHYQWQVIHGSSFELHQP